MRDYFVQFAAYNAWANRRLYMMAAQLSDEQRRTPIGLFFGSLHRTLNHILLADRIWLGRLTQVDLETGPLDKVLHDTFPDLVRARLQEDERMARVMAAFDESAFAKCVSFTDTSGAPDAQPLAGVLAQLFNHQTHHRGQAHTALSMLSGAEPEGLDFLMFLRGVPAPDPDQLRRAAGAA
jgi:uncharacterized damage-inducible protein DinB